MNNIKIMWFWFYFPKHLDKKFLHFLNKRLVAISDLQMLWNVDFIHCADTYKFWKMDTPSADIGAPRVESFLADPKPKKSKDRSRIRSARPSTRRC